MLLLLLPMAMLLPMLLLLQGPASAAAVLLILHWSLDSAACAAVVVGVCQFSSPQGAACMHLHDCPLGHWRFSVIA